MPAKVSRITRKNEIRKVVFNLIRFERVEVGAGSSV
jgi:hypothetical protein